MNYYKDAQNDAKETINYFADEIIDQLINDGEASDDLLNDYPNGDGYHHENHVDKDYHLTEAAELLDQLFDYEETDNGLWEGLEPRRAISAQAAYTYGNAVYSLWQDLINEINSEFADRLEAAESDIEEIVGDYVLEDCQEYLEDHPDCDADADDLDDVREAITEHRKAAVKKMLAESVVEEFSHA